MPWSTSCSDGSAVRGPGELVEDRGQPDIEHLAADRPQEHGHEESADPGETDVVVGEYVLDRELRALTGPLADAVDPAAVAAAVRRFGTLIRTTASLRAYRNDIGDRLAGVAAELLAERTGLSVDDPEPQIAGRALAALWQVQADSLYRHLDDTVPPDAVYRAVTDDVTRAAGLLDTGFGSGWPKPESPRR
ncbi:hypothetical protein ACIP5Y_27795 [Nocardia sp. NPDC088792]|uniref:acyl-CoA-like ligand-binding transcription factor n=1 Tax=Nocardia sp. NPDC088792 TaxID=3364332 RepID=UPI00380F9C42